jgi:parallel beta-helix repeat protein
MKTRFLLALLFLSTINSQPSTGFAQGTLTPPGPPAPTMKTLDQVEARTPIDATHTPGDSDNEFIIAQTGSYYLTGTVKVTKNNGIHVTAAGVTVDLNGFQITRTSGSGSGVLVDVGANNCTIRNGSITGFTGVFVGGIFALSRSGAISQVIASNCATGLRAADNWRIAGCSAHDNTGDGIFTGAGCTVSSCTASSNGRFGIVGGAGSTVVGCSASNNADIGILISAGSTMVDCSASGNQGSAGLSAGTGCTLTHCTATGNTSALSSSAGIAAQPGCTITACTAEQNTNTNATPTGDTGAGISAGSSSKVQNCSVYLNKGDGIRASGFCSIVANVCAVNGFGGDGAGVHIVPSGANRIEGNNVIANDRGIDVGGSGNLIIKNSASGNMPNYSIAGGNVFGEIVDRTAPASAPVAGNSAASSAATTDPWANISY